MMPHGTLSAVSKSTHQKYLPFIDMSRKEPILGDSLKCVRKLLPTIQASWSLK